MQLGHSVPFDLVVEGGEVLDPGTGRSGRFDVAVRGGRVAAVEQRIARATARQHLDARGALVTPGLVDLHTHVGDGSGFWGIDPAPLAWRTGVTTWVDAGSSGAYTVGSLRRVVEAARDVTIRALLNISAVGLAAETGEALRDEWCDASLCARAVAANRDIVVGVKVRLDRHSAGPNWPLALRRALDAAHAASVPLMVHIGAGPPAVDAVLELLRPGDVVTHCATGQSMALVDRSGQLLDAVAAARRRGVLLDLGHGSGAFSFAVAQALCDAGAPPDIVSSDAHQRSIAGPMFDLPTCMAKLCCLGMPLHDVVAAATVNPARAVGLDSEVGTLAVGSRADIAIWDVEECDRVLTDVYLSQRVAARVLCNRATVAGGVVLEPVDPRPPAPWIGLTRAQRSLFDAPASRTSWASLLPGPEGLPRPALEGPVLA
jgi:dihydroorotase